LIGLAVALVVVIVGLISKAAVELVESKVSDFFRKWLAVDLL
jgi:hypothetical protein